MYLKTNIPIPVIVFLIFSSCCRSPESGTETMMHGVSPAIDSILMNESLGNNKITVMEDVHLRNKSNNDGMSQDSSFRLSEVELVYKTLLDTLDCLIIADQACDYYTDSQVYELSAGRFSKDYSALDSGYIHIESLDERYLSLKREKGFFEHRGHLIFVNSQFEEPAIYRFTGKSSSFPLKTQKVPREDEIIAINDDSYSSWYAEYRHGTEEMTIREICIGQKKR